MPTYDYACRACGHTFEEFQAMSAKPLRKCPACGKLKLQRLIGIGAGVLFKGSGFYETDYRSEGYRKAAEAEKQSGADKSDKPAGDCKTDTTAAKSSSSDGKKTPPPKPPPEKGGKSASNKPD